MGSDTIHKTNVPAMDKTSHLNKEYPLLLAYNRDYLEDEQGAINYLNSFKNIPRNTTDSDQVRTPSRQTPERACKKASRRENTPRQTNPSANVTSIRQPEWTNQNGHKRSKGKGQASSSGTRPLIPIRNRIKETDPPDRTAREGNVTWNKMGKRRRTQNQR